MNMIPTRIRVEIVSTKAAERRLRLRSSYAILADEQYDSPVIAAKLIVNLLRNSIEESKKLATHLTRRISAPREPSSFLALSIDDRINRTARIIKPDKQTVPKEGPNAFLQNFQKQTLIRKATTCTCKICRI